MNMPVIQQAHQIVMAEETRFNAVRVDEAIAFQREAEFAMQLLRANDFLAKTATNNPDSLRDAVRNVAAIGVSLNPAMKHAYLVPRDRKVVLDISYLGLLNIAIESGSILWGQAKPVHAQDDYRNTGIDSKPEHNYSPFGNRGDIVGAYCTVKTVDGDYLTHEMPIADIHRIRERSQSFKKGSMSPWKTDYLQMVLKTVVKQASKYWPKSERIKTAEQYLNSNNEGIDFKSEQREQGVNATAEQRSEIHSLLDKTGSQWESLRDYASRTLFQGDDVESVDDLTEKQADQIIGVLKMKAARSK